MPPLGLECDRFVVLVYGLLGLGDGRRGFEGHAEIHVAAVADAALHAARVVAGRSGSPIRPRHKRVIVLTATQQRASKAAPDFEAFGSRQRQHRSPQVGLELVEDRRPEAGRDTTGHASNHPTQGVLGASGSVDGFDHARGRFGIRATGRGGLYTGSNYGARVHVGFDGLHRLDPGNDLDPRELGQQLARDRPAGHPPNGFSGTRAPAPMPGTDPELGLVRVVGV